MKKKLTEIPDIVERIAVHVYEATDKETGVVDYEAIVITFDKKEFKALKDFCKSRGCL